MIDQLIGQQDQLTGQQDQLVPVASVICCSSESGYAKGPGVAEKVSLSLRGSGHLTK